MQGRVDKAQVDKSKGNRSLFRNSCTLVTRDGTNQWLPALNSSGPYFHSQIVPDRSTESTVSDRPPSTPIASTLWQRCPPRNTSRYTLLPFSTRFSSTQPVSRNPFGPSDGCNISRSTKGLAGNTTSAPCMPVRLV